MTDERTQQQIWNDNAYADAVAKHRDFLYHCICNALEKLEPPTEKMHTVEQAYWLSSIIKQAADAMLFDKFNYHGALIGIVQTCIRAHYGYEAVLDAPYMEVFKTEYDYRFNNYRGQNPLPRCDDQ